MRFPDTSTRVVAVAVLAGAVLLLATHQSNDDNEQARRSADPAEVAAGAADVAPDSRSPFTDRYLDDSENSDATYTGQSPRSWNCGAEDLPQFGIFADDVFSIKVSGYAAELSTYRDAEHVLASAMLSDVYSGGAVDELFETALSLGPTHPLVLWWAADLCSREKRPAACRDPAIRHRILVANRNNGAYWAIRANQQLRNGDIRIALESLRHASTAASLDYKFEQQVLVLERGLAAVSDLGYGQRVAAALALAPPSGYQDEVYTACRERIADDAAWAEACLEFGRRLAADGDTLMYKMIGYGIQRNVLSHTDERDELGAVNNARDNVRRDLRDYSDDWYLLMLSDDQFVAKYVEHFAVHGEAAALEFTRDEITRLRALPDYDPCVAAGKEGQRSDVQR